MKVILFTGAWVLIAVAACSSPQKPPAPEENPTCPAQETQVAAPIDAPDRPVRAAEMDPYVPQYPPTASAEPEEAFADFARGAFPPTMPEDSSHQDAWMRTDCLLCHGDGINNAPRVAHRGMSHRLLEARCRSCHLPGNQAMEEAEGVGLDQLLFARNAFPPTLPNNPDHTGAWLRDDCLKCHQNGIAGAPKVIHEGMSSVLLEALCRSCHVTSAPSGELDYPEK
jgi:cytochrome c5